MDPQKLIESLTTLATGLSVLLPIAAGIYYKLNQQSKENAREIAKLQADASAEAIRRELMWKSVMSRGYIEAEAKGHLMKTTGTDGKVHRLVGPAAKVAYQPVVLDLRQLVMDMTHANEQPSDALLSVAILERYSDWMLDRVCTALVPNVYDMGCVAIAMVLARETGSVAPTSPVVSANLPDVKAGL